MVKKRIAEGLGNLNIACPYEVSAKRSKKAGKGPHLLVVGDRGTVDSLQSAFDEPPDVEWANSPDETFHLLRSGRADVVVVDRNVLDQGEAGVDREGNSSDTPVLWLALSPEAVGTLGKLLKAVAKAGQSGASPQGHCQTAAVAEDETD
jgi:ABC-type amino acid transport substrate-binding protein